MSAWRPGEVAGCLVVALGLAILVGIVVCSLLLLADLTRYATELAR